jgi:hypothetical protein
LNSGHGNLEFENMKKALFTAITFTAFITSWLSSAQGVAEFNAGAGIISPPFVLTNGYIFQPIGTDGTNGGCAVYSFTVAEQGQYAIQACVEAPTNEANSILINIDSEPKDPGMAWKVPVAAGFTTNFITATEGGHQRCFQLTSGHHQIIIRGRSPNVKLAHLGVFALPNPPKNLHIVIGP